MTCPLCGERRAKRACPALGQAICPVCCATKRLVEVRCPETCPHLAVAKAHPSVHARRRHDADLRRLMQGAGRLSEGQLQLLFLIHSYFLRPQPDDQPRIVDAEVADAAGALAATFETASRGIVLEHPPATMAGRRLVGELRGILEQAGRGGGSRFESEVAHVLRAIETGARQAGDHPRAYLDLVGRILGDTAGPAVPDEPRMVLP